jgi:hypothetical protein
MDIKYLGTFMKKEVLFLAIYAENEPSTYYVQRPRGKWT